MENHSCRLSLFIYLATITILLVNHFYYFYGHFGYDDMHYARLANDCLNGIYNWNDHYNYRFTIIFSTAISYFLMGINDTASMLPALILSCGIICCFFIEFKNQPALFILSILLYFSFKWNLFYSDKITTDIYVSALSCIAWLIYDKNTSKNKIWAPFIFTILLFLAFNAKGTVVVFIPLFFYYFLSDIREKRYYFWIRSFIFLLVLMTVYFIIIYMLTGNAFSRFNAIGQSHYINPCSYSQNGLKGIIKRLTTDYYSYLLDNLLYIYFIIAFAGIALAIFKKSKVSISHSIGILILMISVNFLPITLDPYNPFCLEPRHSLPIIPLLVICSIRIFQEYFRHYSNDAIKVSFLLILIYLNVPTIKYAQYCNKLHYSKYKNDFMSMISDSRLSGEIYGSAVFKNMGEYFSEFRNASSIQFKDYKELTSCKDSLMICRNWYSEWHSNLEEKDIINILDKQGCSINDESIYNSPHDDFWIYIVRDSD